MWLVLFLVIVGAVGVVVVGIVGVVGVSVVRSGAGCLVVGIIFGCWYCNWWWSCLLWVFFFF